MLYDLCILAYFKSRNFREQKLSRVEKNAKFSTKTFAFSRYEDKFRGKNFRELYKNYVFAWKNFRDSRNEDSLYCLIWGSHRGPFPSITPHKGSCKIFFISKILSSKRKPPPKWAYDVYQQPWSLVAVCWRQSISMFDIKNKNKKRITWE